MALYETTFPVTPYDSMAQGVIVNDVFGIAINWFVNRTPLLTRLAKLPVGSQDFLITNDNYRSRSVVLTAAMTDTTTGTITVTDASEYEVGDVIQIDSELVLVTTPYATSTTCTVTRGYASSTAATHLSGATAYLVTNTRNGAEVAITASSRVPKTVKQNCQVVMHAYQTGGSLASTTNYVSGLGTPLDRDRMLAMQHSMDDFESAMYYGSGVSFGSTLGARAMMVGLANLIVTNRVTAPASASAYKPSDLVRDAVQNCYNNGGDPNVLIVSTDHMQGLTIWGQALVRIPAGETILGVSIDMFEAPFLDGLAIVPAPLLRPGSVIALTAPECVIRMKRGLFEKPRGSRGDATEGDMIMEGAIQLSNEAHHAFVTGITGFSAS